MEQYLNFFITHWELSLLFIAAFIWVCVSEARSRQTQAFAISPQQAIEFINKKSARIFDLRKEENFRSGHIVGAKHVNFDPVKDDPKTSLKISPHTPCVFVCYLGQTTAKTVSALRKKGYTEVFSLEGGMSAWEKENLPVIQGK